MLSLSGWYAQFSNRFQIPCNVKLLFKTTSLVDMSPELFSKRYGWLIKKANIGPQRGRGCLSSIPTYWYIEKHLNLVLRFIFAIGRGHILSAIWVVHRIATSGPWLASCLHRTLSVRFCRDSISYWRKLDFNCLLWLLYWVGKAVKH